MSDGLIHPGHGHNRSIDYSFLERDTLYGLVAQGLTDGEIGQRANCCSDTVQTWRSVWGIRRPRNGGKPKPVKPRTKLTFADILEIGARVWRQRQHRCWNQCPHADNCDDSACRYDPKEDASADPFWD